MCFKKFTSPLTRLTLRKCTLSILRKKQVLLRTVVRETLDTPTHFWTYFWGVENCSFWIVESLPWPENSWILKAAPRPVPLKPTELHKDRLIVNFLKTRPAPQSSWKHQPWACVRTEEWVQALQERPVLIIGGRRVATMGSQGLSTKFFPSLTRELGMIGRSVCCCPSSYIPILCQCHWQGNLDTSKRNDTKCPTQVRELILDFDPDNML